jgi:hypothetical protein
VGRLLDAGRGTVRQVTLAPELPGALAAVSQFVAAGVAVAVGHTNATEDDAFAAFDAGATILTHAFNAMPGIHHREPGPVVAAMRDERVTLEIIADGCTCIRTSSRSRSRRPRVGSRSSPTRWRRRRRRRALRARRARRDGHRRHGAPR